MNSRALRRLAADHGALHSEPLPPNYLFAPAAADNDDLTELDILIAGPTHTPFAAGVFKLHLTIPTTYPAQPPTAHFRTPIFHPNVDPQTGAVCVETLKRDWDAKLTLKNVLLVISCLLVQPNPDSALNMEAGSLIQDNYAAFTRRAELMTSIHAVVPMRLRTAVAEAQNRGQETSELEAVKDKAEVKDVAAAELAAPVRRRKLGITARQRGTAASRRSEDSPTGVPARRHTQAASSQPFVPKMGSDDVFSDVSAAQPRREREKSVSDDGDQENDEMRSPVKVHTPKAATPRRPHGAPVPLGELTMEPPSSDGESDMELEYPPSPRKSPSKSPRKQRQLPIFTDQAESSRDALRRAPNITPPSNFFTQPLAEDSPFAPSAGFGVTPSPRKARMQRPVTPGKPPGGLFRVKTPDGDRGSAGISKPKSPLSAEKRREESQRAAKLWKLCGGDVKRWNRGEFDGEPFGKKAGRW
ncbi:hypothetical protein LTR08_008960 [Meristemomyces frigidus]|nr:hypothetical protein LTR08_008960 [Meristemomyces frigidus]